MKSKDLGQQLYELRQKHVGKGYDWDRLPSISQSAWRDVAFDFALIIGNEMEEECCEWKANALGLMTQCGNHEMTNSKRNYKFCPYCGKTVKEVKDEST